MGLRQNIEMKRTGKYKMARPNNRKKMLPSSSTAPCCTLSVIPDRHLNNTIGLNREFLIRYIEKNG
jgi:hypothetical protein